MKRIFQFLSVSGMGGLEHMVANISTLIKGYEFTCVSPNGPINTYFDKLHIKHINVKSINPFSIRRVIKKYKPDVVQGHDVKASLSLAINYRLCHKFHIKIISQLHSNDIRMKRWWGIRSLLYLLSTPAYNRIIMVSDSVLKDYVYGSLIKNKVSIIQNVINEKLIKQGLVNSNSVKRWDCIYLGRMSSIKNPIKFVKIINNLRGKIRNIKAVMIGNGPLLSGVYKLINKYHLKGNITLMGFKDNPYKYIQQSKIMIVPSIFEGFGLSALEALSIGVPVIASPVGGLRIIVDNTCGGFAKSLNEYSSKLYKLLVNKKLYKIQSYNSIRRSKKINNLKIFVNKYRDVYNK